MLPETLTALPCTACEGDGTIAVRACRHSGACPCGADETPCETCQGTGDRPCSGCGEPAVREVGRWAYCETCED